MVSKENKARVVIISDLHLGTYGCQAAKLLKYLNQIQPETLILNGDIIDIWNFRKSYFPDTHMEVVRRILKLVSLGTNVYYITGNHDEALRKYAVFHMGSFHLLNKLILELDGKKYWIFHGDVFDSFNKGWTKILARMGGWGYDLLIMLNRFINVFLESIGREKMSFSKRVKSSVKRALKWITDFEETAADLAMEQGFDYVVCGHIHQPQLKNIEKKGKSVIYMNSGDWVENLTALEYKDGQWSVYRYYQPGEKEQKEVQETFEKLRSKKFPAEWSFSFKSKKSEDGNEPFDATSLLRDILATNVKSVQL